MWPIPVAELREYAIWGGEPRYWELRRDYPDKETAIRKVLLDPQGPLIEEPQRLHRDDMRDTVQASTLLTIIGNGANKLSDSLSVYCVLSSYFGIGKNRYGDASGYSSTSTIYKSMLGITLS